MKTNPSPESTLKRGKILRQLRNRIRPKVTIANVAHETGIDPGNLSRIEMGKQEPSYTNMRALLDFYGITDAELDDMVEHMTVDVDESATHRVRTSSARSVPLISWVQAGAWTQSSTPLENITAEDWIPVGVKVGRRAYALTISGPSMEPDFTEGERIVVDPDLPPEPNTLTVFKRTENETATFKRLIVDSGAYYLKPINKAFPILALPDDAQYCGRVVAKAERSLTAD